MLVSIDVALRLSHCLFQLCIQKTPRLLLIADCQELLQKSFATFHHPMLHVGCSGVLLVYVQLQIHLRHVFASVQYLSKRDLAEITGGSFDVVIVDEFHHAAAASYTRWLDHLHPSLLLGLTATPERADGLDILHWFDSRIAAELRLWTALDQGLLAPSTTSPWPTPPTSPPWNGAAAATCPPSSATSTPATTAARI